MKDLTYKTITSSEKQAEYYRNLLDGLGPEQEKKPFEVPPESQGLAHKFFRERAQEQAAQKAKEAQDQVAWKEVTVEKNGQVRQAGTTMAEGQFVKGFKQAAEEDLYVFSKGVMGRRYLTKALHLPLCRGLQQVPPFRKLRLLPRDHAKTSVVGHCLPMHIIIQPKLTNCYFPGMDGSECRIMLSGETERRAKGNLRVIATAAESNKVLKALWPEKVWEKAKSQSKKWSDEALIFPRENDYPDPTLFAVGVGGAIAGARPNVQIKDDLISLEAANSETVMNTAIEWHIASRALMDEYEKDSGLESLEYIIGTRWAVFDLYSFILEGGDFADKHFDPDPTVEAETRSIIENGVPIWPERFNLPRVEQLQREFGSMFYLLYMNAAHDPELVDFDINDVRAFKFVGDGQAVEFNINDMDATLQRRLAERGQVTDQTASMRGQVLNDQTWGLLFGGMEMGRGEWFKRNAQPSPLAVRLRAN